MARADHVGQARYQDRVNGVRVVVPAGDWVSTELAGMLLLLPGNTAIRQSVVVCLG